MPRRWSKGEGGICGQCVHALSAALILIESSVTLDEECISGVNDRLFGAFLQRVSLAHDSRVRVAVGVSSK